MKQKTIENIIIGISLVGYMAGAIWLSAIFNRYWLFGYFMILFLFLVIFWLRRMFVKPEEAIPDAELKEILAIHVQRFDDVSLPDNLPAQVVSNIAVAGRKIKKPASKPARKNKNKR